MRTSTILVAMIVFTMTASLVASSSSTPNEGLTYYVSVVGVARGEVVEWLNASGEITYYVNVSGASEVALPEPSITLDHSPGLESVDNAGFSVDALQAKLNSSKEFEVRDPFTGVLNPLFQLSISDFPAILSSTCGWPGVGVESKNVTTTAALTTYEGRDSLEFLVNFRVNYTDGSSTEIITHSIIDLSTLEPLLLENNLSEVMGNCSVEVGLRAVLENTDTLPTGGVHEFRVVTSRGDAVVVLGGASSVSDPVLSGEDSVTFTVSGPGRVAVIVAHTPSAGAPKIVINSEEVEAQTYLFGLGTAYTLKFLSMSGDTTVEIVFSNARVALPWTEAPPSTAFTATADEGGGEVGGGGIDLLPYLLGAVVAVVVGAVIYLVISRRR